MIQKFKSKVLTVLGSTGLGVVVGVPVFASSTPNPVVVTSEMLDPVINAITENLGVLLPAGLTILAVMIGVSLIPRIIYRFF